MADVAYESRIVARWESARGRYWIELRKDKGGYFYRSDNGGGVPSHQAPEADAITEIEEKLLPYQQADANKTPMKRVI